MTTSPTVNRISICSVRGAGSQQAQDLIAVEEPLEIQLSSDRTAPQTVSITMRTPGNDAELAAGFLWSEGAITDTGQILAIQAEDNIVRVVTEPEVLAGLHRLSRNFYTTSSCGVCGKTSLDAIRQQARFPIAPEVPIVDRSILTTISDTVRQAQDAFNQTGGLHGAALLDIGGRLLDLREDVGRHNAVDKLIGAQILTGQLPLSGAILFLSGRASFELLQKARMAGIPIVAAVGAPSSLAVEMARDAGVTLIGFLRGDRFNIYTGAARVNLTPSMETAL
ncbi:sulfurtransferase FdhD [Capsulimonas corticalis]|uniref:Sulfur carrier protein FdhD n=1 Tax=Capsulimonas corticalis TaxID=2219043 RepID=A0A402CQN8_9BACT|nr:formate dehydrogenase accessory sulfurtransferase FdhD [Capsulimonas corticalis]BDI32631.1 sulfurtransferase FdhD [Capsulimonas corticalis]